MKTLRYWIKTVAAVACGALFFSLPGSDVMATKPQPPPENLLWSNGANLQTKVEYFQGPLSGPVIEVRWPLADGADHYRLTEYRKVGKEFFLVRDESPLALHIDSATGDVVGYYGGTEGETYLFVVTAYTGSNEATAYSESLQGRVTLHANN